MCFSLLDSAIAGCGLATRVRFCSVSALAQVLRAAVPYGKIVLIAEEGEGFALAGRLREGLGEFRPVSVVLGGEDKLEGLFSLADDVRAAVGIGERGALAARFFATLRGGYSCAVPLAPHAGGIFEPTAPVGSGWGGYPLKAADFVVADGEKMLPRFAEGVARLSPAAVCAEDLAVDAVFSGERKEFDLRTPAQLALDRVRLHGGGARFAKADASFPARLFVGALRRIFEAVYAIVRRWNCARFLYPGLCAAGRAVCGVGGHTAEKSVEKRACSHGGGIFPPCRAVRGMPQKIAYVRADFVRLRQKNARKVLRGRGSFAGGFPGRTERRI